MKNKNQFRVCLPSTYNENIVLYYVNAKNLLFYCHSWRLSLKGVMFWETKIFSSHKMILLFRRSPWSGGPVKKGWRRDPCILSPIVLLHSIYSSTILLSSLLVPPVSEDGREDGGVCTFCIPLHCRNLLWFYANVMSFRITFGLFSLIS